MELFEEIRREHEFGVGTIQGVSRKLGVHRRMVRQVLSDAVPPARKVPDRKKPRLEPVMEFINRVLEADREAPTEATAHESPDLRTDPGRTAGTSGRRIDGSTVCRTAQARDGVHPTRDVCAATVPNYRNVSACS